MKKTKKKFKLKPDANKNLEHIVLAACTNSHGVPEVISIKVHITQEELHDNIHYDKADAILNSKDYRNGSRIFFDEKDAPLWMKEALEYGQINKLNYY